MKKPLSRLRTPDLAYIALFAVLMAVSAWITVPFAIPFTFQTFAVFLALMTLGGKRGFYAVLVYLLMGLVGLPVFSGFQGGIGVLLGAGGGYIIGFLVAALLHWTISSRMKESRFSVLLASLLGLFSCYGFGTVWFLSVYARSFGPMGLMTALDLCVLPFLIPDLIKLALAFALSRRLKQYIQ